MRCSCAHVKFHSQWFQSCKSPSPLKGKKRYCTICCRPRGIPPSDVRGVCPTLTRWIKGETIFRIQVFKDPESVFDNCTCSAKWRHQCNYVFIWKCQCHSSLLVKLSQTFLHPDLSLCVNSTRISVYSVYRDWSTILFWVLKRYNVLDEQKLKIAQLRNLLHPS